MLQHSNGGKQWQGTTTVQSLGLTGTFNVKDHPTSRTFGWRRVLKAQQASNGWWLCKGLGQQAMNGLSKILSGLSYRLKQRPASRLQRV
jgi:hypothetical protein